MQRNKPVDHIKQYKANHLSQRVLQFSLFRILRALLEQPIAVAGQQLGRLRCALRLDGQTVLVNECCTSLQLSNKPVSSLTNIFLSGVKYYTLVATNTIIADLIESLHKTRLVVEGMLDEDAVTAVNFEDGVDVDFEIL